MPALPPREMPALGTDDYKAFFDACPSPVVIINAELRIAAVNQAYLKATLTHAHQLLGRDPFEVFPDNDVLQESARTVRSSLQRVLETGLTDILPIQKYDIPLGPDAGFAERWWSIMNCPVCDDDGKVSYVLHRAEDITHYLKNGADSDRASRAARIDVFNRSTELRDALARLRDSEELLRATFEQTGVGICHIEAGNPRWPNDRICKVNDALASSLGYTKAELCRLRICDLINEADIDGGAEDYARVLSGELGSFMIDVRLVQKDGHMFWARMTLSAVRAANGFTRFVVGFFQDISDAKLAERRVREAALHDALTGLPNRALVFEYGSHLFAAAQRGHSHGALLFVDLDRFKPINDLYGHDVGDAVLREVADRLRACTRAEDLVGRLGGDEFVILLPHVETEGRQASTVARHVIRAVSEPIAVDKLELSLTPSIGIALCPEHGDDVGSLIHAADLAMYQAKRSGRGDFCIYTPELEQQASMLLHIESTLREALRNFGFAVHYQPVIDLASAQPIGAEALVRLRASAGGEIGPDRFIAIAESTGLIEELGDWVLREVCRQHRQWVAQGLDMTLAVNVSPLQFRRPGFAERLGRSILDSGTDPRGVQIEVTESTVMDNVDEAVRVLNAVKAYGVRVALDDFGTGYSSLNVLSRLPLDALKVDKSFVQHIEQDPASRAIIDAIIALAQSLELDIVGEGIESADALSYLRDRGCTQAQGYWFSRPLPPPEFLRWYQGQHQA